MTDENDKLPVEDSERTRIYLDHNLIDLLSKQQGNHLAETISNAGLVFYTDESLAEIYRADVQAKLKNKGSVASRFLGVLETLNARYLEQCYDSKYRPIQEMRLIDISVVEKYEEYELQQQESDHEERHIVDMMRKMHGGLPEESMSDIVSRQFSDILDLLDDSAVDLGESSVLENALKPLKPMVAELGQAVAHTLSENEDQMSASAVRDQFGQIGPKQLNNICGPEVVRKVFDELKSRSPTEDVVEMDSVMAILKDPQDPSRELLLSEKVRNIYSFLNTIGFYPDTKMNTDDGFTRAASDQGHAYYACTAHIFMSGDHALVRKCAAAFEYLGLQVGILHYDINSSDGSFKVVPYLPQNKYVPP